MRAALAFLVFAAAGAPAWADCAHFKWSVEAARAAFAAGPAPLAAGDAAKAGDAYALTLAKDAPTPYPPERAPKPGRFGASFNVAPLAAGTYQVTLSAEAWIDVVQSGARVKSSNFSGQPDCPGVRKSVRFPLAAGPATVEITNAAADRINFAIAPGK